MYRGQKAWFVITKACRRTYQSSHIMYRAVLRRCALILLNYMNITNLPTHGTNCKGETHGINSKKVYAILKRQISDMEAKLNSPVRYRGTVATADLLPLNPDIGDMYNIESKSIYGEAGMNVAWNGVVWDTMGAPIDMSLYLTKEEAEAVIQRLVTEYFEKNPVKPGATAEQVQQIEQNKTDVASLKKETGSLKEDLVYKQNARLTPVQFQTILGYYASGGFVSGKKEWGARLMRVPCKKGDKYLYHGYCDNIYGVSFLDSKFHIIRQISIPVNKEFEMDVNVIDNASYIDFYSANIGSKTYVLKYNTEDTINNDVGKIFVDASSQLIETDDKYFSPTREELVYGAGMKLKEITPENDTVFKFSFTQHQAMTAYVDDFCIVTSNNYVNGTEVFNENIIVFVPKGKTLRINDYNSNAHVSKFEKLVPITEQYINGKIPVVPSVVDIVKNKDMNPVTSNAVYQAIQSSMMNISTGLPFIAVASSEAPSTIKSVCQFICDGTDDNVEIQNAINSLASTGGRVFLTKGKFFISQPIETSNILIELCGEGALLDLREDTLNSSDRGGTILQAVGNTDLLHIGGAKGTTVHDIAFFGYGRNKVDNTSYGIRFTGYADTDRIYNCGFTNCAVAIGADTPTDVLYIHNLSVQRNKVGICLYRSDAEVHDCLFCENIGIENVSWDNKIYNINCADICVNDGKIYNNTFRRSGMCYDIFKVYGNESGLESDDVRPVSSIVLLGCARIIENFFLIKFMQIVLELCLGQILSTLREIHSLSGDIKTKQMIAENQLFVLTLEVS